MMRRFFWFIMIAILFSSCSPEPIVPPVLEPPAANDPVDISHAIILVIPYQTGISVTWSRIIDANYYMIQWTQGEYIGKSAYWGEWLSDPTSNEDIQHAQSKTVEYLLPGTKWYIMIHVYHQIDQYTVAVIYTYSAGPITIP